MGLAVCCRGTVDEKIHFMFSMFHVLKDASITKEELEVLLNHVPKYVLNDGEPENAVETDDEFDDVNHYTNHDFVEKAFAECDLNHEGKLSYEEFKMWVERTPGILDYMESILPFSGHKDDHPHHSKLETLPLVSMLKKNHSFSNLSRTHSLANDGGTLKSMHSLRSSLSLGPGKLEKTPSFNFGIQKKDSFTGKEIQKRDSFTGREIQIRDSFTGKEIQKKDSFTGKERNFSTELSVSPGTIAGHVSIGGMASSAASSTAGFDMSEEEERVLALIQQAQELTTNDKNKELLAEVIEAVSANYLGLISTGRMESDLMRSAVAKDGYLWKKGKSILHLWSKRYYLLSGNCMYYYAHQKDIRPKGVIFLTGCLVDRYHDKDLELKGYWGIELLHQDLCTGEHHRHDKRVLFTKSEEEREDWVTLLQHCSQVVPIEEDYVIGKELGRGRFSTVRECVNKMTNVHCAVKVIDKASMEVEEKVLLRTEIAVLKLVDHPNIIKMEGLYESRSHIYIVMEMLNGGELFERIVGRPRFTEEETAKLLRPLLESVAYIHDLGIVHRDLKPENILCGGNLEELKIADFGLSKMILPTEKMDSACGTLSYVAPEVLMMCGYGKEADLWSLGVITFLVLCGKLPFDGDDHNEIIKSTINGEMKVGASVWGKLSEDAKDMIKSLLNKNPKERITAKDALRHPFIVSHCPHCPHGKRSSLLVDDSYGTHTITGSSPTVGRGCAKKTVYHTHSHSQPQTD